MKQGLDLGHGGPARRRWARWLAALALAGAVAAALPFAVAGALALPGWLQARLAPALAQREVALQAENFRLRTALAAAAPLAEENAALRALVGSSRAPAGRWCPARVLARAPGTLVLYCAGAAPAAGAAVLDAGGHYTGCVQRAAGALATVAVPGAPACLAGAAAGVLETGPDGWQLGGLPLPCAVPAGTAVTTVDGHWVGTLAAAPAAQAGGLLAAAPLTDTADTLASLYFVALG